MTPEQRAEKILSEWSPQHRLDTHRDRIVAAIKEAILEERAACIALAQHLEATFESSAPNPDGPGRLVGFHDFADALRGRPVP